MKVLDTFISIPRENSLLTRFFLMSTKNFSGNRDESQQCVIILLVKKQMYEPFPYFVPSLFPEKISQTLPAVNSTEITVMETQLMETQLMCYRN